MLLPSGSVVYKHTIRPISRKVDVVKENFLYKLVKKENLEYVGYGYGEAVIPKVGDIIGNRGPEIWIDFAIKKKNDYKIIQVYPLQTRDSFFFVLAKEA